MDISGSKVVKSKLSTLHIKTIYILKYQLILRKNAYKYLQKLTIQNSFAQM